MKTLNELYEEILANDELKKEFAEAVKQPDTLVAFAKANGVEASLEEITAFIKAKTEKNGELSDEELDMVAGGGCGQTVVEVLETVFLFVGCAVEAIATLVSDEGEWGKDDWICDR